jgi:hypothetical protein
MEIKDQIFFSRQRMHLRRGRSNFFNRIETGSWLRKFVTLRRFLMMEAGGPRESPGFPEGHGLAWG